MLLPFFRILILGAGALAGWVLADFMHLSSWISALVGMSLAAGLVALEMSIGRGGTRIIVSVLVGTLFGFAAGYVVLLGVSLVPGLGNLGEAAYHVLGVTIYLAFCYLGITLLIRVGGRVRLEIPFVELKPKRSGPRPMILDTSVIIDGRVADLAESGILDAPVVVPRFVLDELQTVADSADRSLRNRGRRGLDMLNRLKRNQRVDLVIHDEVYPGLREVDAKLVRLARDLDARVFTNDFNLAKIAELQGIDTVSMNHLAKAMRPVVLPGEELEIELVRPGEEPGQGVGYLEDGTMVVAEDGDGHIGERADVVVTSVRQTASGRMIFGKRKA